MCVFKRFSPQKVLLERNDDLWSTLVISVLLFFISKSFVRDLGRFFAGECFLLRKFSIFMLIKLFSIRKSAWKSSMNHFHDLEKCYTLASAGSPRDKIMTSHRIVKCWYCAKSTKGLGFSATSHFSLALDVVGIKRKFEMFLTGKEYPLEELIQNWWKFKSSWIIN